MTLLQTRQKKHNARKLVREDGGSSGPPIFIMARVKARSFMIKIKQMQFWAIMPDGSLVKSLLKDPTEKIYDGLTCMRYYKSVQYKLAYFTDWIFDEDESLSTEKSVFLRCPQPDFPIVVELDRVSFERLENKAALGWALYAWSMDA